ncbi:MAG: hypothetical protein JWO47_787 [Candidatus Saccharibacteria bacterium]|nr:hypothetical protein [Candidatus Saccharibacteria bacterium]
MDDKKTYEELERELIEAAKSVQLGKYYAHYKHPEMPYQVKGLVIMEEDNAVVVRYASAKNNGVEFVRPLSVWLETVEWQGKTVPRFTLLGGLPARA